MDTMDDLFGHEIEEASPEEWGKGAAYLLTGPRGGNYLLVREGGTSLVMRCIYANKDSKAHGRRVEIGGYDRFKELEDGRIVGWPW